MFNVHVYLNPGGEGEIHQNHAEVYDEIHQYHADTEEWSLAGRMIDTRASHAVSTINFEDVKDVCFE